MDVFELRPGRNRRRYSLTVIAVVVGLYFTTWVNYLLFHSIIELLSIIIAATVFILTWNSLQYIKNPYLIMVGISYLFIGTLDLLHTLSYKGMPIFRDYDYYANQLWVAARYMESITLLVAFVFLYAEKRVKPVLLFITYLVVTWLLVSSIFYWKTFPVCFIPGQGLTTFKIYSEYAICGILAASLYMLVKNGRFFSLRVHRLIFLSIVFAIVSEITFTIYIDNYGLSNLVGHYFKLFSFLMIYEAIVATGIEEPFDLIFKELSSTNISLQREIELRKEIEMERERATQSLRESEERFRSLFEGTPDAVFLTLPSGEIAAANPAACAMFGRPEDEICRIGRKGLICQDDPRHAAAADERTLKGRFINVELSYVRKNGEVFTGEADSVIVPGDPPRSFVIIRDITKRKQTEAALKELNQELEKRVAERTAELHEKDQLLMVQGRQAAMGEMIGHIAHQWRQPLNALALLVQEVELTYELGEVTREYLKRYVRRAMELIQHMSRTIDDFRNFFKPDKERVYFSVNEIVDKTLSLVQGTLKEQRVEVEVVARAAPAIEGFPNEFSQVLLNILINAKDALVERRIEAPKVVITVSAEQGKAVVTITDNAGGVPDDIMDKIFEPYFSTKGPTAGTGVGLSMSKTIVEKNLGGRLTVRNAERGAEFRIEV